MSLPLALTFAPMEADVAKAMEVSLTNLQKVFWPELGTTKRDLLLYYAAVAPVLIPHLQDRPW